MTRQLTLTVASVALAGQLQAGCAPYLSLEREALDHSMRLALERGMENGTAGARTYRVNYQAPQLRICRDLWGLKNALIPAQLDSFTRVLRLESETLEPDERKIYQSAVQTFLDFHHKASDMTLFDNPFAQYPLLFLGAERIDGGKLFIKEFRLNDDRLLSKDVTLSVTAYEARACEYAGHAYFDRINAETSITPQCPETNASIADSQAVAASDDIIGIYQTSGFSDFIPVDDSAGVEARLSPGVWIEVISLEGDRVVFCHANGDAIFKMKRSTLAKYATKYTASAPAKQGG